MLIGRYEETYTFYEINYAIYIVFFSELRWIELFQYQVVLSTLLRK